MIEIVLSGFLFWLIIIADVSSVRFGYKNISDLDSDAKLQEINNDPKKFKIGIELVLIEHVSIITLAIMLFLAFSSYNIILAVVWTIFRIGEGLIHIYNEKNYWRLFDIARQFSTAGGVEKRSLSDLAHTILQTKNSRFTFAMILFSVGTLAYSILFATSGVVPEIIGWFGIVASILYGFGSGMVLVRPNSRVLWSLGGLLILVFEIVLGGWLLFSPLI